MTVSPISVSVGDLSVADLFSKSVIVRNTSSFSVDLKSPCSGLLECTHYNVSLLPGRFLFEMWGAGTNGLDETRVTIGGGGYLQGTLLLDKKISLYCYVGKLGSQWNFGTQNYQRNAGASTDIRTIPGQWNSVSGLRSRIMVAGGTGQIGGLNSGQTGNAYPGQAGGLEGFKGGDMSAGIGGSGATQTRGYGFGISGGSSPGGNGYYSGFSGFSGHGVAGGGGGSSFISGHPECNSVDSNGIHTNQPNHFSGFVFSNTTMINGKSPITYPNSTIFTGHIGDGFIRITLISQIHFQGKTCSNHFSFRFSPLFFTCILVPFQTES